MWTRIPVSALFIALALIFSYLERMIPLGVPGVKLGLANLVIIVAMYTIGTREAWIINVVRILLAGLMFTGLSAMLYSLGGGILALLAMTFLKKTGVFSIVGVSIASAAAHNIGQLSVAALVIENVTMLSFLPILLASAVLCGAIIGVVATLIVRRLGPVTVILDKG